MAHISSWSRWRSTMRSVQWTSECSKQVQIFNLSSSAMHNVAHSFLRRLPIKLYTWGQDSMWHHHSGAQYYQPCFNRLSDIKQYNIICLGMPVYSLGGGALVVLSGASEQNIILWRKKMTQWLTDLASKKIEGVASLRPADCPQTLTHWQTQSRPAKS